MPEVYQVVIRNGDALFFSGTKMHNASSAIPTMTGGGNAGPRLNGVARRITRPQILEALISPSARLAPGYGVVTVTTKNGKTLSGMLLAESNSSLTLKSGSGLNEVIPKDQIAKRVNAQSSMPDMKAILSKRRFVMW
jgi:putative heme-binding domain-containing protein